MLLNKYRKWIEQDEVNLGKKFEASGVVGVKLNAG